MLKQPKPRRRSQETTMIEKDDDPRELKQRLAEKDRRIESQEALIHLLTSLPELKREASPAEAATAGTKTRVPRARARREAASGPIPGNPATGAR